MVLVKKGKQCHGGKQSKNRNTVAFFVSAAGIKEGKPIVIWKSKKPRCLKRFSKAELPVNYFSQRKVWMTGEILDTKQTVMQ